MTPTGIAWYRREQWQRLRQISADVEFLEETYEEWLKEATKALGELEKAGVSVTKVDVDVEELLKWCKDQGIAVDGGSRSRFVADKVRRMTSTPGNES